MGSPVVADTISIILRILRNRPCKTHYSRVYIEGTNVNTTGTECYQIMPPRI